MKRFALALVVGVSLVGTAAAEFRFGLGCKSCRPAQTMQHANGQLFQVAKFQDSAVASATVAEPAAPAFVQGATSALSNVLATQAQAAQLRQSQQQQVRGGCNF